MAQAKTEQKKDRVDEIIATGAHKGVLTHDELNKTLTDEEMEPGQLEKILNELEKRTVKVVDHLPDELEPDAKALAEEEVIPEQELVSDYMPDNINIDDPVKMYLKEIGRVPLLSATEEIEIAKRMGQGDELAKQQLTEANL
ncbi:MAG: sigma-70 factor domain-containing protein [Christensenellales bacterium]